MNNLGLTFAAVVLSVVLLGLVPSGNADCCGYWHKYNGKGWNIIYRCADCTEVNLKYCGYGSCNIFGCNCNCRQPVEGRQCSITCCGRSDRKERDVTEVAEFTPAPLVANYTGHDVISYVDVNKDGKLDEPEVRIFIARHGLPADDSWRALDADGDNHLSAYEIDLSLGAAASA